MSWRKVTFDNSFGVHNLRDIVIQIENFELFQYIKSNVIDEEYRLKSLEHPNDEKEYLCALINEWCVWLKDKKYSDKYKYEYQQVRNDNFLYNIYHIGNGEFKVPVMEQSQMRNSLLTNNIVDVTNNNQINTNEIENTNECGNSINTILPSANTNESINSITNMECDENENINSIDDVNININDIENTNECANSINTILASPITNININNSQQLDSNMECDENENTNEIIDEEIQMNEFLDEEQLYRTIEDMNQNDIPIKLSTKILMGKRIENELNDNNNNNTTNAINENFTNTNTSILIVNHKTKKNSQKIKALKEECINERNKNCEIRKEFTQFKRKANKQKENQNRILNNLLFRQYNDDVSLTYEIDAMSTILKELKNKKPGNNLIFNLTSSTPYNCIKRLHNLYPIFSEFWKNNYKKNQNNIIKCKSSLTFGECGTYILLDSKIYNLTTENFEKFVIIKSNIGGYELVNKSGCEMYIIGRDYKNITIYGFIEILNDINAQGLIQKITCNQSFVKNTHGNVKDFLEDEDDKNDTLDFE